MYIKTGAFSFAMKSAVCLLLTVFFLAATAGRAAGYFDLNAEIRAAYADASSLKIQSARLKLEKLKAGQPDNVLIHYIENYADFFQLFIQEDYALFKKLHRQKARRLDVIKQATADSPYYLFCQAEILLQWATVRLKFDEKIAAAKDVYDAYLLLEKNRKLYPDFQENLKSLSIIHALAESVPSWVRKMMGVQGSVALGTQEIKALAEHPSTVRSMYRDEIIAIYSYILLYLNNQKEEAYRLYQKYPLDHTDNPLICFLKATVTHKSGRNDEALRILSEKPSGPEYLDFFYLDFLTGKYKLYKLDPDASIHIERFLKNFKGRHYIKEAWQKMSWHAWVIRQDATAYETMRSNCQGLGFRLIDEDVQAYRESSGRVLPDRDLLKARLLFDGGYFKEAYDLLTAKSMFYTSGLSDGEFYYRMGRITDELEKTQEAINYYTQTIVKGDPARYYPCSAALYLGLIAEEKKEYAKARKYFNQCLSLNPEGYASSLHQKAKAGLDRIKGK